MNPLKTSIPSLLVIAFIVLTTSYSIVPALAYDGNVRGGHNGYHYPAHRVRHPNNHVYYPPHGAYYARQRGYYPPPPPVVLMPPPILPGFNIIIPLGRR